MLSVLVFCFQTVESNSTAIEQLDRKLTIQPSNLGAAVIQPKPYSPPSLFETVLFPSVYGPEYVANQAFAHVKETIESGRNLDAKKPEMVLQPVVLDRPGPPIETVKPEVNWWNAI